MSAFECSATLLYHDAAVQRVASWRPTDGPLVLDPVGGGVAFLVQAVDDVVAANGGTRELVVDEVERSIRRRIVSQAAAVDLARRRRGPVP